MKPIDAIDQKRNHYHFDAIFTIQMDFDRNANIYDIRMNDAMNLYVNMSKATYTGQFGCKKILCMNELLAQEPVC